jgi:hypothetical protein
MAWSWSHTQEAYDNAYNNLHHEGREWLEIVYAEWEASKTDNEDDFEPFDEELYDKALMKAKDLPDDVLVDYIYDQMSEQATCDNGGFNAWACPYGCHTVSFDKEKEEE